MLNADLIIGITTASLAIVTYCVTRDLTRLGGVFVNCVLAVMALLSAATIIKGLVKPERLEFFESVVERNNVLVGVLILLAYLVVLPFVGFLPASYGFYFAFNSYLADDRFEHGNLLKSAGLSFVIVTLFYFVFRHFLDVPLPTGSLLE